MDLDLNLPDDKNWLKRLVQNEAEQIRSGSIDLSSQKDSRKVVEEATIEFLQELREEFTRCVELFHSYRGGAHLPSSVKIFSVSNTAADFILFRGSLKLVVSNPSIGVINLAFAERTTNFAKTPAKTKREGYDLIAQLYPFNDLAWTYHGERVAKESVVRFLFTEFVRSSVIA